MSNAAYFRYHDSNPDFALCVSAQKYFEFHQLKTRVLAASFTSIEDAMQLAGIHHLTLPPHLLEQLCNTSIADQYSKSLFQEDSQEVPVVSAMLLHDREKFMTATERRNHKLSQVSFNSRKQLEVDF